jgi:hypothetical protein
MSNIYDSDFIAAISLARTRACNARAAAEAADRAASNTAFGIEPLATT